MDGAHGVHQGRVLPRLGTRAAVHAVELEVVDGGVFDHVGRVRAPREVVHLLGVEVHGLGLAGNGTLGRVGLMRRVVVPPRIPFLHHTGRGHHEVVGQFDVHVEGAELAVELALFELIGMEAVLVVHDQLRVPLRHVVMIAAVARAVDRLAHLAVERQRDRHRIVGQESVREREVRERSVDRVVDRRAVNLEIGEVEPALVVVGDVQQTKVVLAALVFLVGNVLAAERVRVQMEIELAQRVGRIVDVLNGLVA